VVHRKECNAEEIALRHLSAMAQAGSNAIVFTNRATKEETMIKNRKPAVFAILIVLLLSITAAGCLTVGHEFRVDAVSRIRIGETTRLQIGDIFGPPWRTGIEDGKTTWTYAHYRYSMLGESMTRDLLIRFDDHGVVTSYTFNSSYPEDQRR